MTVRIIESGGGKITVRKNSGVDVGLRPRVNLIEGANITLTVTDDPTDNEIDVVIAATGDLGISELSEDTTPQLGGDLELLEFLVLLDDALSADGKYSGIGENGTAGATLVFGDLCYFSVTDSRWELADASAEATTKTKLGICILAAAGDGSATRMLLWGKIRADAKFPTLTVGAPMWVSTTAGEIATAAPTGTGDQARIIGYGVTADELFFCPNGGWVEHT